jgi:glycosyltransferase involved in cell wall biosynthesis
VKILWVCPTFLHPTTRGGQIRTLGMLREMHRDHEIHFAALRRPEDGDTGVSHAPEFCTRAYAVDHKPPAAQSLGFYTQFASNLFSSVPLAVSRWESAQLRNTVAELLAAQHFDHLVCDFLAAAPNIPDMRRAVLFQHNVEAIIWERLQEKAANPLYRLVYGLEARRMLSYEGKICREAAKVIAVSEEDATRMRNLFGLAECSAVPTGVDLDFFQPPANPAPVADLVFSGSMNWAANIDGVLYFCDEILPLIRREQPDCRVTIVGRTPPPEISRLAQIHPNITVTGTVPDIRPYLWGSKVCVVPLRIGGGTRLKIYECMAARLPVVSTAIGAEGLPVKDGKDILIADTPQSFAEACLTLLSDQKKRECLVREACVLVEANSWKQAADRFLQLLAMDNPAAK